MVKSLEQYLADLPFTNPDVKDTERELSSAERVFVEKYLGMDTLEIMPRLEPQAQEIYFKPPPVKTAEPEIRVAAPKIVVAPTRQEKEKLPEKEPVAPQAPEPSRETRAPFAVISREEPKTPEIVVSSASTEDSGKAAAEKVETPARPAKSQEQIAAISDASDKAEIQTVLKDSLREQEAIQVVSFYVAGQLFLLPVSGIQEVLRRMELVRVPQAPGFIAGAINLRGKVTPLVHLSALLTNETSHSYDPAKNFIIICGTENMQIGLIIDKIHSMHVVPQNKFIWNAESKLGEAAEFLFAIADLDDRVCGVVAPDAIIKKIAAS